MKKPLTMPMNAPLTMPHLHTAPGTTARIARIARIARTAFISVLGLALPAWSADLPPTVSGTWATAGAEFESDRLIGGDVLYVLPNGQAARLGAPLPVRRCPDGKVCTPLIGVPGTATWDPAQRHLRITVQEGPRRRALDATLEPGDEALLLQTSPEQRLRLLRRSDSVPSALAQALTPPRASDAPPAARPKEPPHE